MKNNIKKITSALCLSVMVSLNIGSTYARKIDNSKVVGHRHENLEERLRERFRQEENERLKVINSNKRVGISFNKDFLKKVIIGIVGVGAAIAGIGVTAKLGHDAYKEHIINKEYNEITSALATNMGEAGKLITEHENYRSFFSMTKEVLKTMISKGYNEEKLIDFMNEKLRSEANSTENSELRKCENYKNKKLLVGLFMEYFDDDYFSSGSRATDVDDLFSRATNFAGDENFSTEKNIEKDNKNEIWEFELYFCKKYGFTLKSVEKEIVELIEKLKTYKELEENLFKSIIFDKKSNAKEFKDFAKKIKINDSKVPEEVMRSIRTIMVYCYNNAASEQQKDLLKNFCNHLLNTKEYKENEIKDFICNVKKMFVLKDNSIKIAILDVLLNIISCKNVDLNLDWLKILVSNNPSNVFSYNFSKNYEILLSLINENVSKNVFIEKILESLSLPTSNGRSINVMSYFGKYTQDCSEIGPYADIFQDKEYSYLENFVSGPKKLPNTFVTKNVTSYLNDEGSLKFLDMLSTQPKTKIGKEEKIENILNSLAKYSDRAYFSLDYNTGEVNLNSYLGDLSKKFTPEEIEKIKSFLKTLPLEKINRLHSSTLTYISDEFRNIVISMSLKDRNLYRKLSFLIKRYIYASCMMNGSNEVKIIDGLDYNGFRYIFSEFNLSTNFYNKTRNSKSQDISEKVRTLYTKKDKSFSTKFDEEKNEFPKNGKEFKLVAKSNSSDSEKLKEINEVYEHLVKEKPSAFFVQQLIEDCKQVLLSKDLFVTGQFNELIVVGDIHGCLHSGLPAAAEKLSKNPNSVLVFTGDFIDRGTASFEVLSFVMLLQKLYPERVILLRGNHEELTNASGSSTANDQIFNLLPYDTAIKFQHSLLSFFNLLSIAAFLNIDGQSVILNHAYFSHLFSNVEVEKNDDEGNREKILEFAQNFNTENKKTSDFVNYIPNDVTWPRISEDISFVALKWLDNANCICFRGHDHFLNNEIFNKLKKGNVKVNQGGRELLYGNNAKVFTVISGERNDTEIPHVNNSVVVYTKKDGVKTLIDKSSWKLGKV